MTIKDILPQMQPPARTGGKPALQEGQENGAEPKELVADFEALVREMSGKAEKRDSRISEVRDVDPDEEKSDRKETDPLSALAAQAMLVFDPVFARQAEGVVLSEDAGSFAVAPKGKSVRADGGEEVQADAPIDGETVDRKGEKPATKEAASVAERTPGFPAAVKEDARQGDTAIAPVGDGEGATSLPKPEAVSSKAEANGRPEASSQPDIPAARGEAPANGDRMQANTPSVGGGVNMPAAPAAPAAKPVRQVMHITGVEVISERSNGAVKTLSIRLQPEDLGTVTARLRLVPEGMQVELIADRRETAERLATDRDMLGKALQSAGLSDNAVVAITVSERASPNMAGGQTGQQNLPAQDQSGGRSGQPSQMQGEGNGNRGEQRGNWMEQEQQGGSLAAVDAPQSRRLSRGLVV